jgi:SAM-dependent methyltransferase
MLTLDNHSACSAAGAAAPPLLDGRCARERAAYDGGSVVAGSCALQARFRHVFACPNSLQAEEYLDRQVARLARGRDLLDYGCYDGGMAPRYLNMQPRSLTGIDLSATGIALARARFGSRARFHCGDAHAMPFADESFDLVVGRAILHHLDWEAALGEVRRVLRPAGSAIFVEPLGDNPAAKLLRRLTPGARTPDERPLTRRQIRYGDDLFGASAHRFFNFFSVPAAMAASLCRATADNRLLRLTDWADRRLAATPLRYWMRAVVLVWRRDPARH